MPVKAQEQLRRKVQRAYSAAAEKPGEKHPFPVGRAFAESIGYTAALLDSLPPIAVEAFAGVSNIHTFAHIRAGATILDLGCGAGLDSLIAARAVGRSGKVFGIDFSEDMLERARQATSNTNIDNVIFKRADAEQMPVELRQSMLHS